MNNYIKKLKTIKENQEGFSLIELVVAVGILAILSVVGVVAYSKITENARQTTVEAAAAEVLTGAIAYDSNGDAYKQAETDWMNSAANDSITVSANKDSNGDICVKAVNNEHSEANAVKGAGTGCDGSTNNPGDGGSENGGVITPPVVESFSGNVSVKTTDLEGMGMPETDISVSGTLPEGSTVKVKAVSGHPYDEYVLEYVRTTNLTLTENNSRREGNYIIDTVYTVNSTGYARYEYEIGMAEYAGGNVFVEIQLPDGYTFDDGSNRVVYDDVPEIEVG